MKMIDIHGAGSAAGAGMGRRGALFALVGLVSLNARACEALPRLTAVPCEPASSSAPTVVSLEELAGDYVITFIATEGSASGRSATGTIRLQRYEQPNAEQPAWMAQSGPLVRYPVFGSVARLSIDSIGATAPGAIDATEAARPGVLGVEWRASNEPGAPIERLLRLGSDANTGGPARFDGAVMVMTRLTRDGTGFRGDWNSRGGEIRAAGFFCAAPAPTQV